MDLKIVRACITFPVRYEPEGQMIFDSDNRLICDIRGWGEYQYLENGEYIQDTVGEFVALSINRMMQD